MELQGEVGLVGPSRGVAPSDGQDGAGSGEGKEQTVEERPLGEGASVEEGTELESAKGLLPVRRWESQSSQRILVRIE